MFAYIPYMDPSWDMGGFHTWRILEFWLVYVMENPIQTDDETRGTPMDFRKPSLIRLDMIEIELENEVHCAMCPSNLVGSCWFYIFLVGSMHCLGLSPRFCSRPITLKGRHIS